MLKIEEIFNRIVKDRGTEVLVKILSRTVGESAFTGLPQDLQDDIHNFLDAFKREIDIPKEPANTANGNITIIVHLFKPDCYDIKKTWKIEKDDVIPFQNICKVSPIVIGSSLIMPGGWAGKVFDIKHDFNMDTVTISIR